MIRLKKQTNNRKQIKKKRGKEKKKVISFL